MVGSSDPASGLDAEDAEIDGIAFGGNDAVFADDAVLFAAGDDFSGEKEERTLRIVDENKTVHFGAVVMNWCAVAAYESLHATGFSHDDFPGAKAFVECEEFSSRIVFSCDHGKDRQIAVVDGIENLQGGRDFSGLNGVVIGHHKCSCD